MNMESAVRLSREDRSALMRAERFPKIMAAAMRLAVERGYRIISRGDIAEAAGSSPALVSHYFGTMDDLRNAVMVEAVKTGQLDIVAQGLADGHAIARDAPAELREAAVRALA